MSRGPISLPSLTWKPSATTRGGPSNRAGVAWAMETGMIGAWCEPRMQPATAYAKANGSRTSPTAGSPDWARTIITGSSLPTYLPAMSDNRWVDVAAAGMSMLFDQTEWITYRAG